MRVFKPVFAGLLPLFLVVGPSRALAQQPAPAVETKKPTAEDRKKLREKAFQLLDETVAEIQALKREENRIALSIRAMEAIGERDATKTLALAESIVTIIIQADAAPAPTGENESGESPTEQLLERRSDILTAYRNMLERLATVDDAGALELFRKTRPSFAEQQKAGYPQFFAGLEERLELIATRGNPEKLHVVGRKMLERKNVQEAIGLISRIQNKKPLLATQFFDECLEAILSDERDLRDRPYRIVNLIELVSVGEETNSRTNAKAGKKDSVNISEKTRRKLFTTFGQILLERLKFPPKGEGPSLRDDTDDDGLLRWAGAGKSLLPEIRRHDAELAEQVSTRIRAIENGARVTADLDPERFLTGLEDGTIPFEQIRTIRTDFMATLAKAGHLDRLRKLIERIPDRQMREIRLRELEEIQSARTKPTTENSPESEPSPRKAPSRFARLQGLLQLADTRIQKKEFTKATETLDEALALAGQLEHPYDKRVMECEVAERFFKFNPDRGFELYESSAGLTNEFLAALVVVLENRDSRSSGLLVRNEFSVTDSNQLALDIPIARFPFQTAGLLDFDRTRALVDRIRYPEIRTFFRLMLIKSVISVDEPNSGATANGDAPSDQKEETKHQ